MTQIPYVIDNQTHKMAEALNGILNAHPRLSLDIAKTIRAYGEGDWDSGEPDR